MADWSTSPYLLPIADDRSCLAISSFSAWSLGPSVITAIAGVGWPSANRALFFPFRVPVPVTVYKMACGTGTGSTGNFDLGIYDAIGTRLVSTGSTAKTTASSDRIVDVTDTLLLPGLHYLAMATDGTTNYFGATPLTASPASGKLFGMRQMDTAFPLPSTATFATITNGTMPLVSAYLRPE